MRPRAPEHDPSPAVFLDPGYGSAKHGLGLGTTSFEIVSTPEGDRRIVVWMRFALVIAAAGVLALGVAALRGGGSSGATAAQAPLELRVSQLEARVSGICTAFRVFDGRRAFHDYDAHFETLIGRLQQACGGARASKHEDGVAPRKRKKPPAEHEDRPPPPPPPHED